MITQIKINNFKLFKTLDLQDIPQILLIGGKNNCGKTSLLEAFWRIFNCHRADQFLSSKIQRGLANVPNDIDLIFKSEYHDMVVEEPIIFQYTLKTSPDGPSSKKKLTYKYSHFIDQVIPISNGNKSQIQPLKNAVGVEIDYGNERALLVMNERGELALTFKGKDPDIARTSLEQYNKGTNVHFLVSTLTMPQEGNVQYYSELDKEKDTQDILNTLKLIEPKLQSLAITVSGGLPLIYADIGLKKKVPLFLVGEGMNKLLSILLAISIKKHGIVLIDEIENGFHHSIFSKVWEVIVHHAKVNQVQIMATTHSWEFSAKVAESMPSKFQKDFKYIRLDNRGNGHIHPVSYDFETFRTATENNIEIR